ncbi:hypothetical protein PoB_001862400 [Plakobranchus ocellatus]|uniref:Uncharacterized protein n=1 Tax=Plakobranchus ocellatus TaxID=259542 RepID=A0AAV3ZCM2_9GAST|nr:hypothetical protein PoB_001862400 [Plakobranchus ocellatus]
MIRFDFCILPIHNKMISGSQSGHASMADPCRAQGGSTIHCATIAPTRPGQWKKSEVEPAPLRFLQISGQMLALCHQCNQREIGKKKTVANITTDFTLTKIPLYCCANFRDRLGLKVFLSVKRFLTDDSKRFKNRSKLSLRLSRQVLNRTVNISRNSHSEQCTSE